MTEAPMRRVAVFGNAGGGKSRLARQLADLTGLPLHVLDLMQFRPGGAPVPRAEFEAAHARAIGGETWVIDGFGSPATLWPRLAAADTLVHVDLHLARHHWWVTKRLIGGLFAPPPGWPPGSPLWRSSILSYKVLWACHRDMTPKYRAYVAEASASKRVHRLRAPAEIDAFLEAVARAVNPR